MAKRKTKKVSSLAALLFGVMCVLLILNFALPLLTSKAGVSGIGSTDEKNYGLFTLLEGMSDSDDMSSDAAYAKFKFFSGDESSIKVFTVLSLVCAIVGCFGAAYAVVCVLKPKQGKYMKVVGALVALIAIVTFVFAIVTTSAFSSDGTLKITVAMGIAPILTLVGGLGAVAVPFVVK